MTDNLHTFVDNYFNKIVDKYNEISTIMLNIKSINKVNYNTITAGINMNMTNIAIFHNILVISKQYISDFYVNIYKDTLDNMSKVYNSILKMLKDQYNTLEDDLKGLVKDDIEDNKRNTIVYIKALEYYSKCNINDMNVATNNSNMTAVKNSRCNDITNSDNTITSTNSKLDSKLAFPDSVINNFKEQLKKAKLSDATIDDIITNVKDNAKDFYKHEHKVTDDVIKESDDMIKTIDDIQKDSPIDTESIPVYADEHHEVKPIHVDQHKLDTVDCIQELLDSNEQKACIKLGILSPSLLPVKKHANNTPIKDIIKALNKLPSADNIKFLSDASIIDDTVKRISANLKDIDPIVFIDIMKKLLSANNKMINESFVNGYNTRNTLKVNVGILEYIQDKLITFNNIHKNAIYAYGCVSHEKNYSADVDGTPQKYTMTTMCEGITTTGLYERNYRNHEFGTIGTDDMNMLEAPSNGNYKRKVIPYDPTGDNTFVALFYRYPYEKALTTIESSIVNGALNDDVAKDMFMYLAAASYKTTYWMCNFNDLPKYDAYKRWDSACKSNESQALSTFSMSLGVYYNIIHTLYTDMLATLEHRHLPLVKCYNDFIQHDDFEDAISKFKEVYIHNITYRLSFTSAPSAIAIWYESNDTCNAKIVKVNVEPNGHQLIINYYGDDNRIINVTNNVDPASTLALLFDYKKFDIAFLCYHSAINSGIPVVNALNKILNIITSISNDRDFIRICILSCIDRALEGMKLYIVDRLSNNPSGVKLLHKITRVDPC